MGFPLSYEKREKLTILTILLYSSLKKNSSDFLKNIEKIRNFQDEVLVFIRKSLKIEKNERKSVKMLKKLKKVLTFYYIYVILL